MRYAQTRIPRGSAWVAFIGDQSERSRKFERYWAGSSEDRTCSISTRNPSWHKRDAISTSAWDRFGQQ